LISYNRECLIRLSKSSAVIKVVNPNLQVKTDGIISVKTEGDFAS